MQGCSSTLAGARNDYERMILINSSTEVSHLLYCLLLSRPFGKAARQFKFTTNLIQLIGRTNLEIHVAIQK